MATSISINTSDTEYGTKKQKSVSYIDPQASNADLIAFARGMVSLMADTSYESTTKIDRTECDTTPDKPERVLYYLNLSTTGQSVNLMEADTANLTFADLKELGENILINKQFGYGTTFNFRSSFNDYMPQILNFQSSITGNDAWFCGPLTVVNGSNCYYTMGNPNKVAQTVTFTLSIPETTNCKAFTKEITINITAGE